MMRQSDWEIDRLLDEYQEQEREDAEERSLMGDLESMRPEAVRLYTTFGALVEGDYMTAEEGQYARWVEVVDVEDHGTGETVITFRTPQPLGVGMHDRWVITRRSAETVMIDAVARGEISHGS